MLLYNTFTKEKEEFVPLHNSGATLYACGPTVYNYAHIGNLRTYIFEDFLVRTLRTEMPVKHVINITDVGHLTSDADSGEDKMELGAAREGKSAWDIAKFYEKKFFEDFDALNCTRPSITSHASKHIDDMIALVQVLEQKGYTYKTSDGIYYDTSKFPNYHGLVGHAHISGLKSGARVEFNTEKRNPSDFALWKFSPKDSTRQMEWDSPWGVGFPGWHIECSAMAMKYLGPTIDIHCGGVDHVAVHHSNEIAQSEAATGKPYVRCWVHGEFLVLRAGKMSKSDGTFLTIDALKERGYSPLDYRYLCLGAHYRTQLEFTFESLDFARTSLKTLKERIKALTDEGDFDKPGYKDLKDKFMAAVRDDLNTAKALAVVWESFKSPTNDHTKREFLKEADKILGLDLLKIEEEKPLNIPAGIQALLDARADARKNKDFKKSDELRDQLAALGFVVKDTPQGQVLEAK
ncbi:cysteinyl-tRNA synthetase [Elusimicrobium simillimum]|uniref:cysteine--tRNA ligase n=1 Tax=Elusimicrobium simillimum TaxID=3143438 RepID=UPI003C704F59